MSLLWQAKSEFYYRIATGRVGMTPPQSAGLVNIASFRTPMKRYYRIFPSS